MEPLSIISLITLVFSVIATGAEMAITQHQNNQNIELQQNTLQQQQEYATQAAQTANETTIGQYNLLYSPAARRKQLEDANLSVGLMYGGGGSFGQGSTAAQAATPTTAVPYLNPLLQAGQMGNVMNALKTITEADKTKAETAKIGEETENLKKQREQIDATIKETEANIKLIEKKCDTEIVTQTWTQAKTRQTELENKLTEATMNDKIATVHQMLDNLKQAYEKGIEEINGMKIDNANKQELYDLQKRKFRAEIANIKADTMLKMAQEATEQGKQALMKLQEQTEIAKAAGEWGKVSTMTKERELMEYQIDQVAAFTKALENQAEFTETQNDWYGANSILNGIGNLFGGIGNVMGGAAKVGR